MVGKGKVVKHKERGKRMSQKYATDATDAADEHATDVLLLAIMGKRKRLKRVLRQHDLATHITDCTGQGALHKVSFFHILPPFIPHQREMTVTSCAEDDCKTDKYRGRLSK